LGLAPIAEEVYQNSIPKDASTNRRDVYLIRSETGWQIRGREGGADGREVVHYFDAEDDARALLRRMLDTVPPEPSDWAQMTTHKNRPR
jgi:hypothetical protein